MDSFCNIDMLLQLEKAGVLEVKRKPVEMAIARAHDEGKCIFRKHDDDFFTLQIRLSPQCTYTLERVHGNTYTFENNRLV